MRFVYVMKEEDRDKMLELGYSMIKVNDAGTVWVFENKDALSFSCYEDERMADISFVLSDVLTF